MRRREKPNEYLGAKRKEQLTTCSGGACSVRTFPAGRGREIGAGLIKINDAWHLI
jgi:hypothetical protein